MRTQHKLAPKNHLASDDGVGENDEISKVVAVVAAATGQVQSTAERGKDTPIPPAQLLSYL